MNDFNMRTALFLAPALLLLSSLATTLEAEIRRDPNGVNVNAQGATSVFITYGGLEDQIPVEATWCGELIPATPDIGFRCDPSTIFGRLPIRFDQSRLDATGRTFTDIMSIPPSVARRAYQAAERGANSSFFYVRRFVRPGGGPDEYVFVTCRMTGGGARTPLALLNVELFFGEDEDVLAVERGSTPPPVSARIHYNGSGRLVGRWEVVLPGEDPPTSEDLLTESSLPPEARALQRRYTLLERFNVFLPPTGRVELEGPDPARIPTETEGLYQLLLRVEASDDKEGDSNLRNAGAGQGILHNGAVAGFPMPILRYYVGTGREGLGPASGLSLLLPRAGAALDLGNGLDFSWSLSRLASLHRLEIEGRSAEDTDEDSAFQVVHQVVVQQGIGLVRLPSFVARELPGRPLRWRVVALGSNGRAIGASEWRSFTVEPSVAEQ